MQHKHRSHHIPERFLRQLWQHQYFETSQLQTTEGHSVEIVSPGNLNHNGGPDFLGARVRIGGTLFSGDVELHQNYKEWTQHAHHLDARYDRVILHVVLYHDDNTPPPTTKSKRVVPVLILERFLNASYRSIWEQMILNERAERLRTIKCFSINSPIEPQILKSWIEKLALERMELKIRRMEERLKELVDEERNSIHEHPPHYGEVPFGINPEDLPPPVQRYDQRDFSKQCLWNQVMYEGIMEALGYSKNQQPFLKLSCNIRLRSIKEIVKLNTPDNHSLLIEALLFSIAGLLPSPRTINDIEGKCHSGRLRKLWKIIRHQYRGESMDETEWQFFRLRPENFPTVRLAGAARLIPRLLDADYFKSIVQIVKSIEHTAGEKFKRLESLFQVPPSEFWSSHYTFENPADRPPVKLIGKNRSEEIVLNVVVPLCLLYGRIFRDKDVRQGTLEIFKQSPALSENTITRIINDQLVKSKFKIDSTMLQQGSIQLYKYYCVEERCEECAVGKVVGNG